MSKRPDGGFVLPTSLLVLALLTVMLTAAFVVVSAEYRSTDNSMAGTRALALAQAGLQSYFASNRQLQPTDWGDSVRYTYTGGYTDVVARKMRNATSGITTWIVRASASTTDPLLTGQITAKRSVAQLAQLNPVTTIIPRAAVTALNGATINGPNTQVNPIDGANMNANAPSCALPSPTSLADTNGIQSPGTYAGNIPTGGSINSQPVDRIGALYDSTHINWPAILAGNFTPDYTTAASLPNPSNSTPWSVGYINGDLTIPYSSPAGVPRRGVLIVTGNLTLGDGAYWAGLLIVGGQIIPATSTSNFLVEGATYTGMNCYNLGGKDCTAVVPKNSWDKYTLGSNYREFRWSYCFVQAAISSLSTMVPIKNTFIDNWAGY